LETRASYLFVGIFVLVLMAGAIAFGMWMTRAGLADTSEYYYMYFTGSVAGLQNGSAVQYRGVPVGTVTDIAIDEGNVEQIQVTVAIREGTPIKTDTVAQLQLQGITGLSFVQLSGGTQAAPALEPRPGKRRAVIRTIPSPLERVFERVPELTGYVVDLAAKANDILNDQNRQAINNILSNLDTLLATASASRDDLSRTLKSTADAAASLDELARELRATTASLGGDMRRVAGQSEQTAAMITKMADEFRSLAADNRAALRDFSDGGLYEISQFFTDARGLISSLQRLTSQIERDPARFLFGDQTKGVEAK
jgi:phospholipid/cholesterol/gamma-HCH transport system substrate-binding protein